MEYTPGNEELEARSVRLPGPAWEEIQSRARAAKRKPLDWLRLQIYEKILADEKPSRRRAA